jgi:hypothetical protein
MNHWVAEKACRLLQRNPAGLAGLARLAGDGSSRGFYRLRFSGGEKLVAIVPGGEQALAEARSAWHIGRHLFSRSVPVPEYFAFDRESGLIISEDLGDVRLHGHVLSGAMDSGEIRATYVRVIRELVRMQLQGSRGFRGSWCWQTPFYDRELMLARESGYFLDSLCRELLHVDVPGRELAAEFEDIADCAAAAPAIFFLHRDFQSRNIMLKEGRIRIIDFQGGRLGPLAYDLASLLLDPYVGLPNQVREELAHEYILELNRHLNYDAGQFRREYTYLSLQRNLQMLGAFAFLSGRRGKVFFRPYIRPALLSLQSLLAKPLLRKYSALTKLTDTCLELAAENDI